MAYNLLIEPILSWRDRARCRQKTTVPGMLALLASGDLIDFPRVRPHQLDAWQMFLTQLAAIALHRAGLSDPRLPEARWRQLLLALTAEEREPWELIVADLSKAAFFQPPVPESSLEGWQECESPDDIDILATAKNHDVKRSLIRSTDPESWVYSLGTLQTMQGYPGRGYTRVARMNGGYGNRPYVGLVRDLSLGSRFTRDVEVLLDSWPALLARGYTESGAALVWTEPWDGRNSLAMHNLSPHFIEVCWRVRCVLTGVNVTCRYTTTKERRCVPEIENGDVGDPWIPVERAGQKALTVGSRGFDYRLLTRLVFDGDFEPALAQRPRSSDADPVYFRASALARGQGKTEGLHQRSVAISGVVRRKLGEPDGRHLLGRRALAMIAATDKIQKKVLYPVLKRLAGAGKPMRDDLDSRVDEIFFDQLFNAIDVDEETARLAFERCLADLAKAELARAIDRFPTPNVQRLRAITDAERMLNVLLRKHFPDATGVRAAERGVPA